MKRECRTCRYFEELIGLGRPHPQRCIRRYLLRQASHLDLLPKEGVCWHWWPEGESQQPLVEEER